MLKQLRPSKSNCQLRAKALSPIPMLARVTIRLWMACGFCLFGMHSAYALAHMDLDMNLLQSPTSGLALTAAPGHGLHLQAAAPPRQLEPVRLAQSAPDPLIEVRRMIERGWWQEAKQKLEGLTAEPSARQRYDVWLLRAEVCFHEGDIRSALQSLDEAQRLVPPNTEQQPAALKQDVLAHFGQVELSLEKLTGLELHLDTPLLDAHALNVVKKAQQLLRSMPQSLQGSEAFRVEWLTDAGTPQPLPKSPPYRMRLWLPAGSYRLNQLPLTIEPGKIAPLKLTPPSKPTLAAKSGFTLGPQVWLPPSGLDPTWMAGLTLSYEAPIRRVRLLLNGSFLTGDTSAAAQTQGSGAVALGGGIEVGVGYPLVLWASSTNSASLDTASKPSQFLELRPEMSLSPLLIAGRSYRCWMTLDGSEQEGNCDTSNLLGMGLVGGRLKLSLNGWELSLRGQAGLGYMRPLPPFGTPLNAQWRFEVEPVLGPVVSSQLGLGHTF